MLQKFKDRKTKLVFCSQRTEHVTKKAFQWIRNQTLSHDLYFEITDQIIQWIWWCFFGFKVQKRTQQISWQQLKDNDAGWGLAGFRERTFWSGSVVPRRISSPAPLLPRENTWPGSLFRQAGPPLSRDRLNIQMPAAAPTTIKGEPRLPVWKHDWLLTGTEIFMFSSLKE